MRARTHTNPFNFYEPMEKLNLKDLFPTPKKNIDLEIGFGRGVFLQHWAKKNKERNIIGVEIRKKIVEETQSKIQKNALHNLKTLHCNGEILLRDALDDNVIENLFIFHPDPWFKTRHHKRRVINSNSIKLIKKKLTSEGKLHFSTDVKSLWEASKETILKENFKLIDYNHFWEDDYITHWNKFSDKDNRITYKGTFSLKTSDS